MKKKYIAGVFAVIIILGIFIYQKINVSLHITENDNGKSISIIGGADGPTSIFIAGKTGSEDNMSYSSITMEEAKKIFETDGDYIILDVRRSDEYDEGHIPTAFNIANEDIIEKAQEGLPNKDQTIYVYCRSGRRSKEAASKLAALGYTNIIECGGILDWTGEIE